jgi:UDPglucose 6-dehydrogenase
MKITVFGCSYVGLTTAIAFANMGHSVMGVDTDEAKIASLNRGKIPFYEPELQRRFKRNITFSSDARAGITHADIVFCAVGTPPGIIRKADLSSVLKVAASFGRFGRDSQIFVNKSTVPVGTSEQIRKKISASQLKPFKFHVVSNPEFLRQGSAYLDFMFPDRIIIGLEDGDKTSRKAMEDLYKPITRKYVRIFFVSIRSAEIIKYASNAFLATKVSFVNELANFCDTAGADVQEVLKGVTSDKRIGSVYMRPGIGFGGSCLPKDLNALIETGKKKNFQFNLLKAVKKINDSQPGRFAACIIKELAPIKGKRIAIWGITFKPGTDDLRAAPSVKIIEALLKAKAKVQVHDPVGLPNLKKIFKDRITYCKSKNSVLLKADCLLVLTEWPEFLHSNKKIMRSLMKEVRVFRH